MEQFENLLTHLTTEWDGALLIMGDFNIYLLDRHSAIVVQYKNMLDSYSLHRHVKVPTCITSKLSMLIDHIVCNVPNRVTYTNVFPCPTVSDHDAPYVCRNVRVKHFQSRYKFIRSEKEFDEQKFIEDFSKLPLNLIYSTDDIDEKLNLFNSTFPSCLDIHAPLRKIRVTRPPAPWLKSDDIQQPQMQRNDLRYQAHQTKSEDNWKKLRGTRNSLRTKIKQARRTFYQKALSSKKPKELWHTIHRILNSSLKPLAYDPEELNVHFTNNTQRILGTYPSSSECLKNYITSFSDYGNDLLLRPVSFKKVEQQIKSPDQRS